MTRSFRCFVGLGTDVRINGCIAIGGDTYNGICILFFSPFGPNARQVGLRMHALLVYRDNGAVEYFLSPSSIRG